MKNLLSFFQIQLWFAGIVMAANLNSPDSFGAGEVDAGEPAISSRPFGQLDGQPVSLYTLTNANGMTAEISDYGGVVVRLLTPDRDGTLGDVVLGYDNFEAYKNDKGFYGAIVGRYANRIAKGKFSLAGKPFQLATNNGPNFLHGGNVGFGKRLWKATASIANGDPQLRLDYVSPDGEEGFPGNLQVVATYRLTPDNGLKIQFEATTDKTTLCNLTHHGYWNLAGLDSKSILDHELQFSCDAFTPVDETAIPTGEILSVEGTPFDFRQPRRVGELVDADNEQIRLGRGYDHNFVINGEGGMLRPVARLRDPHSGRVMEMSSSDHGVQFYTGNFFDGSVIGKADKAYTHRIALCLECQRFPDSPNRPEFPSAILEPGKTYQKTVVYQFSQD